MLLAMPMFNDGEGYQLNDILDDLRNSWKLTVSDIDEHENSSFFLVEGETVTIAYMPTAIPRGDIEGTAQYAYNWPSALEDLANHNGHAIVAIMSSNKSSVERFMILSKVLCSILSTSNAIGVYQGSQSLLIPKSQYLLHIDELESDEIPLMLWIYIGLRKSEQGNSAYTYGLTAFQKQEMEIINSALSLDELHDFLSNICDYVITNNISFRNNETIGSSAKQKIKITSSPGHFVEGQSFKLGM